MPQRFLLLWGEITNMIVFGKELAQTDHRADADADSDADDDSQASGCFSGVAAGTAASDGAVTDVDDGGVGCAVAPAAVDDDAGLAATGARVDDIY